MAAERRHFTCVTCPVGCEMDVELDDGHVVSIDGNRCKKAAEFVLQEVKEPMRILTTTIRIRGAKWPMLPVRTNTAIPKRLFFQAMKDLADIELKAPVNMSDVIVRDIAGSGANVVASRNMNREVHTAVA